MIDALRGPEKHRCTADHEHDMDRYGEAMQALFEAIHDAVKGVCPEALIEFRMNYSNLLTRSYATSHRAQDAPYDFDHTRRLCTRLKSYMIDPQKGMAGNVAVHTDPAYWLPQERPEIVACFMASLVTSGVPMLSMDLRHLPEEHGRIVRAWLGFYRQHRELLLFGAYRALSTDPHFSVFQVHRGQEALWGIFASGAPGELRIPDPGVRRLWVLNGSPQPGLFARLVGVQGEVGSVRVYDRGLTLQHTEPLLVKGASVLLDIAVEIGGALEIIIDATEGRREPG